jgi:methyl-accepting chemotaxis protein
MTKSEWDSTLELYKEQIEIYRKVEQAQDTYESIRGFAMTTEEYLDKNKSEITEIKAVVNEDFDLDIYQTTSDSLEEIETNNGTFIDRLQDVMDNISTHVTTVLEPIRKDAYDKAVDYYNQLLNGYETTDPEGNGIIVCPSVPKYDIDTGSWG